MSNYSIDQIRKSYLAFFEKKEHLSVHSFPLIPKNDPTLLLINAGMAPLKKYFTGADTPPSKRMVTCQKCVRTGDIDNVGHTARHCTFFEMLGNFSFGDYFKREAIFWAWEFLTQELAIPENQLWVSVYHEDDEAYQIWADEVNVPEERIVRLGKADNFWELEVGPSGPCSEIYYDKGTEFGCSDSKCAPGCDCDRYVEIWNLVFTQFDKDSEGVYHPLANPNIDTGMGLERVAAVLQGKDNVFEVAPFMNLIEWIEKIGQTPYKANPKTDISIRIIADHARAITFLIGDGVIPSNEGRGYVLRRLLRRASRHGKLMGIEDHFLADLSKEVIQHWGEAYPELKLNQEQIFKIITMEEEKFNKTIHQGMSILDRYCQELKDHHEKELSGEKAFKLYDTYGFPFELTEEILKEKGYYVSFDTFSSYMTEQKEKARKARGSGSGEDWTGSDLVIEEVAPTRFKGYDQTQTEATIIKLYNAQFKPVTLLEDNGYVVLDQTVLYAESGGQKGDRGQLLADNLHVKVVDVVKANNDIFLHKVSPVTGQLSLNQKVEVILDGESRQMTAANHTATHLLHWALKEVLGSHVNQAGSLVEKDRLRFDYSHFESPSRKELTQIEALVNEKIFASLSTHVDQMSLDEAKSKGITALFDSKYGDKVRVVVIEGAGGELCGGTHVNNTAQVGLFKIVGEGGISSGIRRIEALTGRPAYDYLKAYEGKAFNLAELLKTPPEMIEPRIDQLLKELKEKDRLINQYKNEAIKQEAQSLLNDYETYKDIHLFTLDLGQSDSDSLRNMADMITSQHNHAAIVLAAENNGKVLLIASISKSLVASGLHAGKIVKAAAEIVGGGGGGRPDFAQAGGKRPDKISQALERAKEIMKEMIK